MAQFQVLGSAASPFVRKVLVMVKEAGMTDVVFETVKASPMGGDAHLNAANPSGRIPVLLREGDSPIFDSRVITRFLDQHAQAGLYPESRLWEVLTTEAAADGMIEAVVAMVYEKRFRPETHWYEPWYEGQWAKVERALDYFETQVPSFDQALDMGQIAVGAGLGYLDFRQGQFDWRATRPNLTAFFDRLSVRPSFKDTFPVG